MSQKRDMGHPQLWPENRGRRQTEVDHSPKIPDLGHPPKLIVSVKFFPLLLHRVFALLSRVFAGRL
jgi:hypothetical protein